MKCPNCGIDNHKLEWTRPLWTHTARGHKCNGCLIVFETHELPVTPEVAIKAFEVAATQGLLPDQGNYHPAHTTIHQAPVQGAHGIQGAEPWNEDHGEHDPAAPD